MVTLSSGNDEAKRDMKPKFEYLSTVLEEAEKLNRVAAAKDEWNFDDDNKGFEF